MIFFSFQADIQCNWNSLSDIIDHWGNYSAVLAPFAGPGHFHDPDMLLVARIVLPSKRENSIRDMVFDGGPSYHGQ